jgi:hypothetical protein
VPEAEQVPHRLVGARRVRGRDRRDALVQRHERVEHDEPVAAVEQPLELLARLLGQDDQRAVGQPCSRSSTETSRSCSVAGGREDDLQVALGERLGRAREDRREVGGVDERNEDADQPGGPAERPARASIGV